MPPGTPDDGFSRMIATAHEAGVPSALDSRSDGLAQTLSARPTVVKINVHEAAELSTARSRGSSRSSGPHPRSAPRSAATATRP